MTVKNLLGTVKNKIFDRFSLNQDTASQQEVTANVLKGIEMRGINLWVLIFAILVASLGLNTNSTAVIIGAMLISPLMGPIIGMGFAAGTYDYDLLKKSFRNFLVMVALSLVTSSLFFLFPIISEDSSELLRRTEPTFYDLLIALFGGLAGMMAQTRKDRTGTVIAGVAIATALMPPLCTVGYGIASLQPRYVLGALYLFTINSVFIALASFVVTRMLGYRKLHEIEPAQEKRLKRSVYGLITVVTIPSVIIAIGILQRSLFNDNARNFVNNAFQFEKTVVIDWKSQYGKRRQPAVIEVRLVGENLSENVIENLSAQMQGAPYNLKNTQLRVVQAGSDDKLDVTALQTGYADLLEEKNRQIESLKAEISVLKVEESFNMADLSREMGAISSGIDNVSMSRHIFYNHNGLPVDTILMCVVNMTSEDSDFDSDLILRWLKIRTGMDKVHLVVE